MHPVLWTIPGINRDIPGFGVMLMIGFLLAIVWAVRRATRSGANPDVILNCGFLALVAGVVGCRAMYVVHYWDQFASRGGPVQIALGIIDITRGGMEYYGGFVLSLAAILGYFYFWGHSVRWYADIVAPSAALGLAFGRLGCFLNGCCYGGLCEQPWGVAFPFGSNTQNEQWKMKVPGSELREELIFTFPEIGISGPISRESLAASDAKLAAADQAEAAARKEYEAIRAKVAAAADGPEKERLRAEQARAKRKLASAELAYADLRTNMKKYGVSAAQIRAWSGERWSLPVHPTQIYSAITALLLALLLSAVYWRRTRDGQVVCTLLVVEPVSRWLLEVIRTDNPVDTLGVFTISQAIAIGLTLLGVAGFFALRALPPRSARARRWTPEDESAAEKRKAARPSRVGA